MLAKYEECSVRSADGQAGRLGLKERSGMDLDGAGGIEVDPEGGELASGKWQVASGR
jgi:hypothetical protein